jgi:hypothetical protein
MPFARGFFASDIRGICGPAFVERMPLRVHTAILDAAVIAGGLVMISSALRSLL